MKVWSVLLVLSTQLLQLTTSQPAANKSYHSETDVTGVCAGASYELGCGYADGTKVMKLVLVTVEMLVEDEAFQCGSGAICMISMGEGYGLVTEEPLLNLYKSIEHNCQGKPMCTGTLPTYSQVSYSFPPDSHDFSCGYEPTEFLSKVQIKTTCVAADGTVPTLEPYAFTAGSTTARSTTTTSPTTTTPTTPTTPTTTTKALEEKTTTVAKGGKKGKHSSDSGHRMIKQEMWIIFAVLGSVAVVATLVGVGVTVYILRRRSRSRQLPTQINPNQQPLHEKGDFPLDDKQPMYT